MVSLEDSRSYSHSNPNITSHYHQTRPYYYTPPPSSARIRRAIGRSMRTIRSKHFQTELSRPNYDKSSNVSENLTDSVINLRLGELANKSSIHSKKASSSSEIDEGVGDTEWVFNDGEGVGVGVGVGEGTLVNLRYDF